MYVAIYYLFIFIPPESGAITTNVVNLSSSSFPADSSNFSLTGDTRGGPPTIFDWRRNGVSITSNSSFAISISLQNVEEKFIESVYVSTLVVKGNFPGVYQYSVINKAMAERSNGIFTIEGKS